jgi:lipoyl(octanoyl) transferase
LACSQLVSSQGVMDRSERLVIIPYCVFSAPLNMAIDEVLFLEAQKTTDSFLRFYGWDKPSMTFGYFQRPDTHLADNHVCVRRLTGGGIVLHDGDLTFSFCGLSLHPFSKSKAVYRTVSRVILDSLSTIYPAQRFESVSGSAQHDRFYNCFDAPSSEDILFAGKKVYGGAIRRTRNAFLLQGTLSGNTLGHKMSVFMERFSSGIARNFSGTVRTRSLTGIIRKAQPLAEEKYGQASWNFPKKRSVLR